MRVSRFIAVLFLAGCLAFGLAACSGGDDDGKTGGNGDTNATAQDTTAASNDTGVSEDGGDNEAKGPARSKEIDELLTLHPIFSTKRFMNFAARGNPGACSLLSAKGRKAMQAAHGTSCEETIRVAAAGHDEPGLVIGGEFVPIDDFSDLDYRTTIYVFEREQARVTIGDTRPQFRLSQYGRIWLIDSVSLTEIGSAG